MKTFGNSFFVVHSLRRCAHAAISLAIFSAFAARAQTHSHEKSTNGVVITPAFINELVEEARTNNPGYAAAKARVDAAKANIDTVRRWEDPMVRFGVMTAEREMRADDGDLLASVEQKLPVFGKTSAAREVAAAEARVSKARADAQLQQLRKDVAQSLFKMAVAQRVVEIGQRDLDWLETMVGIAEQRLRAGEGSQIEILRLQNERSKRIASLKTDAQLLEHEQVNLHRLLNQNTFREWPKLQLPNVAEPLADKQELLKFALRFEPKLNVLREQIHQSRAMVEQAKRNRFPDFTIGAEVRQFSETQELRQGMLTASFNFPWGNSRRYRAEVRREEENLKASELETADYELAVQNDIHHLTVKIESARREALLYRDEIMPRSKTALEIARTGWSNNQGMLSDVLESRRMLLESELMYARAVSEQYQMIAELALCCGVEDLEALGILGEATETQTPKEK